MSRGCLTETQNIDTRYKLNGNSDRGYDPLKIIDDNLLYSYFSLYVTSMCWGNKGFLLCTGVRDTEILYDNKLIPVKLDYEIKLFVDLASCVLVH